ncbi:MAG: iron-containing alcohol dehydrogenase, partial [Clostridia bacterium]
WIMKNYTELLKNKNATTQDIKMGYGVVEELGTACKKLLKDGHIGVVYFEDCKKFAKQAIAILNQQNYRITEICYAPCTLASLDVAQDIIVAPEDIRLFVAVGSGALSDIVRYACFCRKTPYVFVATAPSSWCALMSKVDYVENGQFLSAQALPPTVLIVDYDIVDKASDKFFAAGYGEIFSVKLQLFEQDFARHILASDKNQKLTLESFKRQAVLNFFENYSNAKMQIATLCETLVTIGLVEQLQPSEIATNFVVAKLIENCAIDYVPFGINMFLATVGVMQIYEKILNNKGYLLSLPTNILSKTHRFAKTFGVETNLILSKYKWNDCFEKELFIYEEYREEFGEYMHIQNNLARKNIKQFRRIFDDVGFWLNDYISAEEVVDCISLASVACKKSTLLAQADILGLLA